MMDGRKNIKLKKGCFHAETAPPQGSILLKYRVSHENLMVFKPL